MKSKIANTYRCFALIMAFLMLITSVSFAVDLHYCGNQVQSFGIFSAAKNCHELAKKPACKHHPVKKATTDTDEMKKKGCCKNQLEIVELDGDLQQHSAELQLHPPLLTFIAAYFYTLLAIAPTTETAPEFTQYRPPLVLRDFPVLHQSFLL